MFWTSMLQNQKIPQQIIKESWRCDIKKYKIKKNSVSFLQG
jgi:hypothetical protein